MSASSRARVWAAIQHQEGVVPWLELSVDHRIMQKRLGKIELAADEVVRCHHELGLDGIGVQHWHRFGWKGGTTPHIKSRSKLADLIPAEPDERSIRSRIAEIADAARRYDLAVFATMMLCFDPASNDIGYEDFCYATYDDPEFVSEVLDRYTRYNTRLAEIFSSLPELDLVWVGEDIAHKTGLLMTYRFFQDELLPRYRTITAALRKPWLFHSDGNYSAVVEDLIGLGCRGFHPFEVGAMDIMAYKKSHGHRIVLCGDVLVDLIARARPRDVASRVHELIAACSSGGGYILTSGNSIPSFALLENVEAMGKARDSFYGISAVR